MSGSGFSQNKTRNGFTNIDENETKGLLESYGIEVPPRVTIRDLPTTVPFEFPAVLKVCDPSILHKTDVGGVVLDIKDSDELEHEFLSMKQRFPVSRFLVEKMEKQGRGIEVIVGVTRDHVFGLTIMLGLGGIYTELYKDCTIRRLPIEELDADEMISGIKATKIFEGFRNMKASKEALKDVLLKVSKLAGNLENRHLYELDLNPVLVRESDAVVLDAKAVFQEVH